MKRTVRENREGENKKERKELKLQELLKGKIGIGILVAVAIILCIGLLFSNFNQITFHPSSEIARSMTYDRVEEGDEKIERYRLCKV